MGVSAPRRQRLKRVGFLECGQVLPLEVLDQGEFDDLVVVGISKDDGQLAQAGLNGRLVAPFASDDLVPARRAA